MKVIELLNKIANGEEVPKFWWNGCIHQVEKDYTGDISIFDTYCKKYKKVELEDLNEEIKFLEEDKKIEKIDVNHLQTIKKWKRAKVLGNKINEIIDKITELETK
jgi:hypothetical protein